MANNRISQVRKSSSSKRRPKSSASLASPARICAYEIISVMRIRNEYFSRVAPKILSNHKLSPEDRAFAILLARGVVSMRGSLDELINSVVKTPKDAQDDVRDALRVGTYELFYLKKEPYAVADQTVELVRHVAPRAARLGNFVMRRLCNQVESFPYGSPEKSIRAAALKEGFPLWLATQLESDMGKNQSRTFMKNANNQAPVFFTINENRVDSEKVLDALRNNSIEYKPFSFACTQASDSDANKNCAPIYQLEVPSQVGHQLFSGLVTEGGIILSDASAQYIASLALPSQKPGRFLEIGAGNGTKTLLLQNEAKKRYGSQIVLHAVEINKSKAQSLRHRLARAHVQCEEIIVSDGALLSQEEQGSFDAVFIDAPCTGVGTLRRHPEIRWRLKEEDSSELSRINFNLLATAASLVNRGGRLCYATCTPLCKENEEVILKFLTTDLGKQFQVVPVGLEGDRFFRSPLNGSCDIHFACVLVRKVTDTA